MQNIDFPNVVDIIDGVRISGEAFSKGPMHLASLAMPLSG